MPETHSLIQQAERHCESQGARFTPIRRRVLEMIATTRGGLKAYELLDRLTQEHAAARPPTVYRALEFLIEQSLIHRIESLNAYVACPCPEHTHGFQLLICRHCGRVEELHLDDVNDQLARRARDQGFRVERQTIELLGSCPDCLAATGEAPPTPTVETSPS